MSRLPAVVFAMLAMASAGAFFVVQHLKSTTPLIAGFPQPVPAVFNPRAGVVCKVGKDEVNFREMNVSFYLKHRSDDVDVYVVDESGEIVATLGSGVHMIGGENPKRVNFTWYGHESGGRFAPDGTYFIRVDLIHQGRSYIISPQGGGPPYPVRVETHVPEPVVTSVTPQEVPGTGPTRVVIRYRGNEGHYGTVRIYRTDLPGPPRLVDTFETPGPGTPAVWDGTIDGHRAPAGVYLVGLDVTDQACNTGHFPRTLPPPPGSTPHAGVTVRYLVVRAPLTPVRAGTSVTVGVSALHRAYSWALRSPGASRVLASGSSDGPTVAVPLPGSAAGVYVLRVRAGTDTATVPLVASAPRPAPVLVVLPALTWQGVNPVDETGDGLPNTLTAGRAVALARPLVTGAPPDLPGDATLLAALRAARERVDVTTDLALITGAGPALAGHHGVILAATERWITPVLAAALRGFVVRGGTVLSLGAGTLRATVHVQGERAVNPSPERALDIFGVRHGDDARGAASVLSDELGLFSGNPTDTFAGFAGYEPITGVDGADQLLAAAGTNTDSLAVAGVRHGNGNVLEVGLDGFAQRLGSDPQARALLSAAYALMTG